MLQFRPSRCNDISPTSHWRVISVQVTTKQLLPKPIIMMAADFSMLGINILEVVEDWRAPLCFKRLEKWSAQRGRGWKWKALLEEVLKQSVDILLHISCSSLLKNAPFLIIPWIYSSFPKFFHTISERLLHEPIFCSQQDAGLPLHWASFCIPHIILQFLSIPCLTFLPGYVWVLQLISQLKYTGRSDDL